MKIHESLLRKGILNQEDQVIENKVKPILFNIKKGLKQYLNIQQSVHGNDVSKNQLFQELFSNFYRVDPFRDKEWKKHYFSLFENSKDVHNDFDDILKILKNKTGKVEASFSSKLIATLDPTFPVIDSKVIENLGCVSQWEEIRSNLEKIGAFYKELTLAFKAFLTTRAGENIIKRFKNEYPHVRISEVKILDFILWQIKS